MNLGKAPESRGKDSFMTKNFVFFAAAAFFLTTAPRAHALPVQPAPFEESSPALQLARRVASMENSKDLPSRAVWLGKQAAHTTQLAYQPKAPRKAKKKKPARDANN